MSTRASVLVVGGGYGGRAVAKALDAAHDVTLVTERDAFLNNVGSLRAVAVPGFAREILIPFDHLLKNGKVITGRVTVIDDSGATLADGRRLNADYVVVATGSHYPFPGKPEETKALDVIERLERAQRNVASAASVLIAGAGPAGVELAGEIVMAHPGKKVTVVESGAQILPGPYKDSLRRRVSARLSELNVDLIFNSTVNVEGQDGALLEQGRTLQTTGGHVVPAEVFFTAHGARPRHEPLAVTLADALDSRGRLKVDAFQRVTGHQRILAVGDITDVNEPKQVVVAERQAKIAAATVSALARGRKPSRRYKVAKTHPLLIPIGPHDGAGQLPLGSGVIVGARLTRTIKGARLFVPRYRKLLGQRS